MRLHIPKIDIFTVLLAKILIKRPAGPQTPRGASVTDKNTEVDGDISEYLDYKKKKNGHAAELIC